MDSGQDKRSMIMDENKIFYSVESLYQQIQEDKNWTGAESAFLNRYPLRFVLFENFSDYNEFVQECSNHHVLVQSMEKWMADDCYDQMMTYSQLAERFKEYVKSLPFNDFVIAPFSEITRFYDNKKYTEFDSLLKTIRLIESPEEAQLGHQRIYVPIIGMQSKMSRFKNDPNIHIWEYRSGNESQNYQLILVNGTTYGIQGLETEYTLCNNLRQWIALWKAGSKIKKRIICSSRSIFGNASNAQPDNAFDYVICNNAYDFLRDGLHMDFGNLIPKKEDMIYWEQLASRIDITDFNFEAFVNEQFNAFALDDERDFIQAWFEKKDSFSRWVLKTFFLIKYQHQSYLNRVLASCDLLSTSELFSGLAMQIFDEPYNETSLKQRLTALGEAEKHDVQITELAERKIKEKLMAIAADPEKGYYLAMRYITPLTLSERLLMIEWLGDGKVERESVKSLFPYLYNYTIPFSLQLNNANSWINNYFSEYCKSKIANNATVALKQIIEEKNTSPTSFELWRDNFKTVKTLLYDRDDIDVFYWIDGLGVDWIPFVIKIIEQHKVDGVYLNEVHIATAELPTRTFNNKVKLEELSPNGLDKIGDIDSYAHTQKSYPEYIMEEFSKVKKAISTILNQYNGKKIAFVSDHGISYLACRATGLNIAGLKSDHSGRCAICEKGNALSDNKYVVLDDGKTICSLTHHSLTTKTPEGQGAHGGATPEEVLVPIIIVSNQKNANSYSVKLIDNEISVASPTLRYNIKGLSSVDIPMVRYNDVDYSLCRVKDNIYESERLNLVETSTKIILVIGSFKQTDSLIIKTGVSEEDLFGGL